MELQFRWSVLSLLICLSALRPMHAQVAEAPHDSSLVLEEFDIPTDGDALLVSVTVNGRECVFMVDTGAYWTVFDTSLKPLLGTPVETRTVKTPLGSVQTDFFNFPPLKLGRIATEVDGRAACLSLDDTRKVSGQQIDGILGMDVLSQYVVRLDFDQSKLLLLRQAGSEHGTRMSIHRPRIPTVEIEVPGLPRHELLIDTGHISSSTGSFRDASFSWLEKHGRLTIVGSSLFTDASRTGRIRNGVVRRCSIGGFAMDDAVWSEHYGESPDHVSLYFLTQFNVTFDFPNAAMYLSKSKNFGHLDSVGLSGLHFRRINGRLVVEVVDKGSLAEKCGIEPDDVIKLVDGRDAGRERLFVVRKALSLPGGRVSLVIERGSETFEAVLILPADGLTRKPAAAKAIR